MESEEAANEEALFSNLPETRVTFTTASQSPDEVAELDNVNPIGPAISLSVGAGDTIRMEGYAYFEGGSGYSSTTSLGSFIASVAGAFGGLNGGAPEQQVTFDAFDNAYGILGMNGSADDNVPAAYLNYIFFDDDMVYKQSGFKQISGAADFSKEYVEFPTDIIAPETGFIYCFVSMESATGRVFWDDFKVTVNEHPVVQRSDYYPFGSIAQQYNRITTPKNRYLYNDGTERVDALDLGVDMTPFRVYDPMVGRWWQVDPIEKYHESSYAWVTNNPILWNDPLGLDTLNTTDPNFDPSKINDDDVVIGPNVLDEVVVSASPIDAPLGQKYDWEVDKNPFDRTGEKVMGHRDGIPGLEDFFGHRTFGPYDVNAEGKIIGVTPATGEPPVGSGPVKILSVVKRTQSLLRLAQQTGKSPVIRKEINKLLRELIRGNFNAGKGSKSLGFGGVHEMRGANGARVYYKNTSEGIKIVGYSNKANQSKVIGELKKLYD